MWPGNVGPCPLFIFWLLRVSSVLAVEDVDVAVVLLVVIGIVVGGGNGCGSGGDDWI